jgi:hypothetical protein
MAFPRTVTVEQSFLRPRAPPLGAIPAGDLSGRRVAVAVGSRGVAGLPEVVRATVALLRARGAAPQIVPAMGSHGGATAEGQARLLARYGITEASVGAPVVASMETVALGPTELGNPVFVARAAYDADGIVPVNRVKPHTDFTGRFESGLMKMMAVGLGNVEGAAAFHRWGLRLGHSALLEKTAERLLATGKVLFGVAIVENAYHEAARVEAVAAAAIPAREPELLAEARRLMPSLPAAALDVLVVERIGKDVSGVGRDPNVTGRRFRVNSIWQEQPAITRIAVLDLTEATEGNAVGLGLADFCTERAVRKMSREATYANALTAGNLVVAHVPAWFPTDLETVSAALGSVAEADPARVRLARIRDTLSLDRLEVSEALVPELGAGATVIGEPKEMAFDNEGNLL